ncbi:hypothetical protein BN7_5899 [Wickerhamomyces ciferrii]|uniref:Phosphoribulokinase/uridine kinase domain-containing protein n=1 Tax=Wickerhamomyces ciferrii (strain ATCC 14091 / BCRC 22168 / CBS 111 / JCM 3599 / NBRC 0793 / NRRL Y-1031 F-60-10) TaxID=1206466 RepID=K0KWF7_WICCF|nr:uncharacterized protein BN7_5899 [Wickerhamomyces ciferrii]CCH46307.1 hypothetical protein BN7_5899 [Wickerhamomyces ciferrii]
MGSDSVIILVGGGHAAGKVICERIKSTILENTSTSIQVESLDLDTYVQTGKELDENSKGAAKYRFDDVLDDLEQIELKSNSKKLILIYGLYSLYNKELRNLATMKLFIDCDADTRLSRWISEDVLQKKNPLGDLLEHYINTARPEFNEFIFPTKEFADVILPSDQETNGISLICDGILPLFNKSSNVKALYPRSALDSNDPLSTLQVGEDTQQYYDLS